MREFGSRSVEDEFPHCGPLGGIHAALGASPSELNMVLSVDTPLVTADFLRYLLQRADANPMPWSRYRMRVEECREPVRSIVVPFRAVAEQQLKKGRYKVTESFSLVRVDYVEEQTK